MVGIILLCGILSELLPVLDQVDYARHYVAGTVAQGYMTREAGDRLLQQQEVSLRPFVFQIVGVLGAMLVLWMLGAQIERSHRSSSPSGRSRERERD
jgi:hypothetical protein